MGVIIHEFNELLPFSLRGLEVDPSAIRALLRKTVLKKRACDIFIATNGVFPEVSSRFATSKTSEGWRHYNKTFCPIFCWIMFSNRSENTVQHDATWTNDGNQRTSDENII